MAKTAGATETAVTRSPRSTKRRTADVAYDRVETLISKLAIQPGSPIVEAELAELTGLGRTPVREALLRMISIGLVVQQPRRGLQVSAIDVLNHLDVLQTRRVLELLIAACAARRTNNEQRTAVLACAHRMVAAAEIDDLDAYMEADQAFDHVVHDASRNQPAVHAVIPLIVQCRRFWYAYRHEGDMLSAARAHLEMAEGIASGREADVVLGVTRLMDYLELFARRVINA